MNLCEKKIDAKFDEVIELFQGNEKNQYGIIYGNNIVVFIKAGLQSSCYGYENKYAKIGRLLNEKHGCSIISSLLINIPFIKRGKYCLLLFL